MKAIVITTIFPPSEAVKRFAAMEEWALVVVGDRKTPADWNHPGVKYVDPDNQLNAGWQIAEKLPWNHYARKMVGYLEAMALGADIIADTDDDNIPGADWAFPAFAGAFDRTAEDLGFINVYRSFTDQHIWPRGFPLKRINEKDALVSDEKFTREQCEVGIWQALADGDPDVDAIYRLTCNVPCIFNKRPPIVLGRGTLCPFNSQNSAFTRAAFPLLYLPATVTFRFTDILRSLVAQPILWMEEKLLGFTAANVTQERNEHDYLKDFESELPCYLHGDRVAEIVGNSVKRGATMGDNLLIAYDNLQRANIVDHDELSILRAWLDDIVAIPHSQGAAVSSPPSI